MTQTIKYSQPVPVTGCPICRTSFVFIKGIVATHPETINLALGVTTRNPARLVGWDMSCGCTVSGSSFTLMVMPDQPPYFKEGLSR